MKVKLVMQKALEGFRVSGGKLGIPENEDILERI